MDFKKHRCYKKERELLGVVFSSEFVVLEKPKNKNEKYICLELSNHSLCVCEYYKDELFTPEITIQEINNNFSVLSNLYNIVSTFTKLNNNVTVLGFSCDENYLNKEKYILNICWLKTHNDSGVEKYLEISYCDVFPLSALNRKYLTNLCHCVEKDSFWDLNLKNHNKYYLIDKTVSFKPENNGINFENCFSIEEGYVFTNIDSESNVLEYDFIQHFTKKNMR